MAKLVRPVLFSQAFDVPPDALRVAGLLDPVLNSDTKLFIDPLLLKYSRNSIIKANGLALLRERFDKIIRLITASKATSDAAWRAARRLMNLEERKETCLGYGGSGVSGRSRPDTIKDAILNTTKEVLDLGVDDPEIISLMGIFEEKVGPDTISDLTTNAIMPALARITETVCKEHNIQRAQFIIEGETLDLPVNPVGRSRHGIVLVPRDILRQLPIATDWSEISDVAYQNKLIRDRVNALIADFAKATLSERKRAMKDAAFQSARTFLDLFEGLLNVPDKEYDASRDQAGIFAFREALLHVASRYPHRIAKPKENTREELTRIVADIVEQFRALVEKSDLSDLLWYGDKPRNEKASQLLFFAVAEAYCRANDIDISPETDSGGGPVDFKFSKGYDGRHLVEVKLSTGKVVHGYKTQLLVYREAAGYCEATFLVINVGKMGAKLRTVLRIEQSQKNAGEYAPALVVVDATRKPSASKR